jgi:hypothetical protein
MLLLLLMAKPLAAEEGPLRHDQGATISATNHGPFALVAPWAVDKEALFPAERSVAASDADRWPFAPVASLAAEEKAPFVAADGAASSTGRRSYAQASPSAPAEVAPIPFEVREGCRARAVALRLAISGRHGDQAGLHVALPRGVSLVYTYVERDIKITKVRLGVDGAPLRDVTNFVNLGSTSHVNVAVGRFDAWLLPFLNVYAMAGYVSNNTTTKRHRDDSAADVEGRAQDIQSPQDDRTRGFRGRGRPHRSGRLARIVHPRRISISARTDIGFDNPFRALIGTVRAGWNGALLGAPSVCG